MRYRSSRLHMLLIITLFTIVLLLVEWLKHLQIPLMLPLNNGQTRMVIVLKPSTVIPTRWEKTTVETAEIYPISVLYYPSNQTKFIYLLCESHDIIRHFSCLKCSKIPDFMGWIFMTVHTSPADEFHPWCFCIPHFSGQLYPDMGLIFHSLFG